MKVPFTKYGWPQVVIWPAGLIAAMVLCSQAALAGWVIVCIETVLFTCLVWALSFFRDPTRRVPQQSGAILAPADGKITDIETVEENDFIGGKAIRIGIFLSIFNVHINRCPCNAKVEKITYRKGKYKNAADPQSGRVNESNDLWLSRNDSDDKLIVRQISGAIARRIVCRTSEGEKLASGEKFGMIKFGSRTELYLPLNDKFEILAEKGDKVRAGLTIIARDRK